MKQRDLPMATAVYTSYMHVLREVYDIYKSSYRIMGDNLGGGEQRATD